ncbi:MAG: HlyD family efflux transporter periplasmic adaptor subunit [Pseudomonadota bacterium]
MKNITTLLTADRPVRQSLPTYGLWLPLQKASGGLLLVRDKAWEPHEIALLAEWIDIWRHAWQAKQNPHRWSWRSPTQVIRRQFTTAAGISWWKQRRILWLAVIVILLLFPVHLTVLSPGELVPTNPAVIRAPLDGVVANFAVKPNEFVKAGQLLFTFDQATILSRLDVARQALATAETEYRQSAQLAVSDAKYKAQLATLTGKIEERRTEADYLQAYLDRSSVTAPRDGIALFDDPSEWGGKPVVTGERIMRIAASNDLEVEAWLPVGDAIPLDVNSPLTLYLNATPLFPVSAAVRYMAHDAVERPDGGYAYRVRAQLDEKTTHRVGLKGTAKLRGGRVPLCYWMLRRPLAAIRQFVGW